MSVPQELLDMLVCPLCKVKIQVREAEGGLFCPACRRLYPVVDDIPVMLVDKAKVI